jgi:hypothetical protein
LAIGCNIYGIRHNSLQIDKVAATEYPQRINTTTVGG